MRLPFKILLGVILTMAPIVVYFVDGLPPRNLTATRMSVTKRRILNYARLHGQLPPTLAALPPMPNDDVETLDAWGHPLDYRFDRAGVVTLVSLGEDHLPGGDGDACDLIGVFASRDEKGQWRDELAEWKENPLRPDSPMTDARSSEPSVPSHRVDQKSPTGHILSPPSTNRADESSSQEIQNPR